MLPKDNARSTLEYDNYYIIQPDFRYFHRRFDCNGNGGKQVKDDFEYNSGTNPWFLTIEEMREIIKQV
jgi:UDP-N-acetylglucosamine 4,6-dehydratase